jgi:SAM-dependent methyltransferase
MSPDPNIKAGSVQSRLEALDAAGRIFWPARAGGTPRLKHYLDELQGSVAADLWADIGPIGAHAQERLGYPTQKPLALLERIIEASSNPGDLVLDPFCGCGTAMHASQRLDRRWIGIDITHLAIQLIEKRLRAAFPGIRYVVHGEPKDLASALDLARRDKFEFEKWVVAKVDAQRAKSKLRGPDRGIDGVIYFRPDGKRVERAVVSVKGGENIGIGMVRELRAVMERDGAPIGVLVALDMPTRTMEKEAAAAGLYEAGSRRVPRLQILTLAEIFEGKKPDIPLVDPSLAFKLAKRETRGSQGNMDL